MTPPGPTVATGTAGRERQIVTLFESAFAAAEGRDEGALIAGLVRDLLRRTPPEEIHVFRAEAQGRLVGAAIFTRLAFPQDDRHAVLLSPLAVAPDRQRRGVGGAILRHALAALAARGVDVALTYGDPDYYARTGFAPVTEEQVRPPLPLSAPHGWLGQVLAGGGPPTLRGPSSCVPALDRPDIW